MGIFRFIHRYHARRLYELKYSWEIKAKKSLDEYIASQESSHSRNRKLIQDEIRKINQAWWRINRRR